MSVSIRIAVQNCIRVSAVHSVFETPCKFESREKPSCCCVYTWQVGHIVRISLSYLLRPCAAANVFEETVAASISISGYGFG